MVPLSFAGEAFLALPEAALYWPARRALLVADLHFEKASWYARFGQFLPPHDSQATLDMIDALVDKSRTVDGKPTSLKDLGYDMIGIGDWAPPASRALPFVRLTAGVSVYGQTKAGKAAASVSTGRSIMPTGLPRSAPTFPTSKRWSITATAKA